MSRFRALVAASDLVTRATAVAALEAAGCEVLLSDAGSVCVERARAERPDLLVLIPPLMWASAAGVLAALHESAATRPVPVLILDSAAGTGPFPRVPRLFFGDGHDAPPPLPVLIDRACAQFRQRTAAPESAAETYARTPT